MLTNKGLEIEAKKGNGLDTTTGPWVYLAFDASSQEESATDTAPISEITTNGWGRVLATPTYESPGKMVLSATILGSGPVTIGAICVMSAATGGVMLDRTLLTPAKQYGNGDQVPIVHKIPFIRGT